MTIVATEMHPLNELRQFPGNARVGNKAAIRESLRAHGQYRAIVVNRRDKTILAGNHVAQVMTEEGWQEAWVHWVDVDNDQAKRINLMDNRAREGGKMDNAALTELLGQLGDLTGTGYDHDDLDDLRAQMEVPSLPAAEFGGGYVDKPEEMASRAATDGPGTLLSRGLKETILVYSIEQAAEIEGITRTLRQAWGLTGNAEVIMRALREFAHQSGDG